MMRSVYVDSLARQYGSVNLFGRSYVLLGEKWTTGTIGIYAAEAICEEDGPCIDDDLYPLYWLSYNGELCFSETAFAYISKDEVAEAAEKAYKYPATAMAGYRAK